MRLKRNHSKDLENDSDRRASKLEETAPSISYFTLYRFASRRDRFLITIAIIASITAGATLPYSITLVADLFQNMINYDKAVQNGTEDVNAFLKSIYMFGINYSCVGALLFICGYLGSALLNLAALNQVFKIREEYLTAVLNQDFSYFDLHKTGDFASKMADDVIKLEEGIGDKVSAFLYSGTTAVGCIVMAIFKGWKLALLCLATTPVTFFLVGLTGRIADRLYKKEAIQKGLACAVAQEVLSSIRTVYAFNGQKKELERYKIPLAKAKRIYIKKEFFTGLSMGFLFLCVFCSYSLSFYFGIYLVIHDPENYNADVMFSVFFGVMTALGNLGIVGSLVRSFGVARGAGAQIFRLLDNVPTINPLLNRGFEPYAAEGTIELKNVVFRYPSRPDVPVLKGVSLSVKRGQSVALVGHSGCGKSTIIQLISRYYDVIAGCVCVDGIDVRDLTVRWLRSQIGLVGQEPVLFNTTIRENIRYGRHTATNDDIEAVAKQANAHHFIIKLPKMYETLVGERGASLSGGQKQRIAIARALIRNPRLLLLDEATSALDTASEAKVQLALDKAAEGRTTVVVAHRLSTIRHVDMIYVMNQGEVVEMGSHDELMSSKGHYYDMVVLQEPRVATSEVQPVVTEQESRTSEYEAEEPMDPLEEESQPKVPRVSFWRVLALNAKEWNWLVAGAICSIIIGFSMPLFILIFGDLFGTMSDPDPNNLMEKVKKVSVACIIIGAVMGLSTLIETLSFGVAGAHLLERIRSRMFAHLLQQHVAYFDQRANSTGALCAKLSSEASYVQGGTGQRIGVCLQGFGSIGLALVLAMMFEWRVGLVALAFLPLVIWVVYQQVKATRAESYGNAKALENSTKIAIDAVSNVRTVVSLEREQLFVREYVAQLVPALTTARRSAHCKGLVAGLSRSMFNFINAAALTYGGHLIVAEGVAYQNILVTTQSLQMASGQAQNAFTYAPQFQKGVDAASRIIALLNTKPEIRDPDMPAITPFKSKGEASLKDVEFRYPTRPGVRVLRGLDLQIESGKTIALVGRSGCGKSTVIQLLQRYYDPDMGLVCLDDISLRDLMMSEARGAFGLVSQEPVLFDYSIAENIAYGDLQRAPTQADVEAAAKKANIHNFIVTLPEGYDTNIGPKGMQLSGGQKQRVAIARALIRHPKILLLDEATSALDTESEKEVAHAVTRTVRVVQSNLALGKTSEAVQDVALEYHTNLNCLDDISLRDLMMSEARGAFGLVSQEPVLFDYSIAENIAYGDLHRAPTQADVEAAAKEANIHNFIVTLPEGYDTNIGPKGMQLSGGQKQRVAIARALIRHPKILLLDEATSALDTESEKVVQEALDAAKAGRTCVMIAHRLSTVRDADRICVLSNGSLAEAGTHDELLAAKGIYYNLYSTI